MPVSTSFEFSVPTPLQMTLMKKDMIFKTDDSSFISDTAIVMEYNKNKGKVKKVEVYA